MVSIQFDNFSVMPLFGKDYLIIELSDFENKAKARKFVSENKGKFVAEIKKYRRKRSLDANSYFWLLVGKLAAILRITTTEIYRGYITEIGDNFEILPIRKAAIEKFKSVWSSNGIGWVIDVIGESKITGYINVKAYYGSSVYTEDQMGRLIDLVVQDCKLQGIETKSPAELERLKKEWQTTEQEQ